MRVGKELKADIAFHRAAMLAQLSAYKRQPSMEQAAFDMAAKHAVIFNALLAVAAGK